MASTEAFMGAVRQNDIRSIRIMMKNSLLSDRSFNEFDDMSRKTANVPGLYDKHDGQEFEGNHGLWDKGYMNGLMVEVVNNFSRERLAHIKEVVRHLTPVSSQSQTTNPTSSRVDTGSTPNYSNSHTRKYDYAEQKRRDAQSGRITRTAKVTAGAVAGAVVGGLIAEIVGGAIIVGAVVGATAVGAVAAIATNGEK